MKRCEKCKIEQPLEAFNKGTKYADGLQQRCRACQKAYREANKERLAALNKQWAETHKAERQAYSKQYRATHAEQIREAHRIYTEANRDKVNEWNRLCYHKKRDQNIERGRAKYLRDKERLRPIRQQWAAANPEKLRVYVVNYRARRADAEGFFTEDEWTAKLEAFDFECAFCRTNLLKLAHKNVHAEHLQPLSRGGSNWIDNIVPSCNTCNLKKNAKTAAEFIDAHGLDNLNPALAL